MLNRKILFRGKSVETGEWVYGDLLWDGFNKPYIHRFDDGEKSDMVLEETLGQFTNTYDKNNVPIYEGDYLNSRNDGKDGADIWGYGDNFGKTVKWNKRNHGFSEMPDPDYHQSIHSFKYIEVVGNKIDGIRGDLKVHFSQEMAKWMVINGF